ncbi:peptidoglycan-binding protein [Streptomyces sp. NPDC048436]|uniref:peptidoglycan-binding domain-containing protein n=1 Tax=Streptomyces sp. NPDC048436 TaxID=3365550 RepID=UPI003724959D
MSSTERPVSGAQGGHDGPGGQRCPECGTSREAGSAPACGCTERAADAARDTRSADAAAVEDFDPLRIRPYVTLPEPGPASPSVSPVLPPEAVATPRTADVGLFRRGAADGELPGEGPRPAAPSESYDDAEPYADEPEPRRRRTALYAGIGAVVAVVAGAALAAALLAPDKPQREQALPDVPTRAVHAPSGSARDPAPTTASPSPSASRPPSPSTSTSTSASRSASASPSPTASAERDPTPSPSRSTARATGSVKSTAPSSGGVLRQGDRGPEVKELQQRLHQLYLYLGEANGHYNTPVVDAVTRFQWARGTQRDGQGVYGEATRAALEAETSEP